jgi:DNA-binding transcriptional ArsR family regulator
MLQSAEEVLRGLRAAAEPTRLRMLAVLSRGEFSVTDLTEILGQSQPRVSRHLKLLGESGLLDRFREQHWIFYRVPVDGPGAALATALLALIDTEDPAIALDRERADAVLAVRATGQSGRPDARRADSGDAARELAQVVAAEIGGDQTFDAVLYVGPEPAASLAVIGPMARRVVGLCASRAEVQRARALLHGRGLAHCLLQHGDLQSIPHPGASFDAVILDRALGGHRRPMSLLREAARVVRPRGRLVTIEDYDDLAQQATGGNPLRSMREWIAEAGLRCVRLRPLDLGDHHLIVAAAVAEPAEEAA